MEFETSVIAIDPAVSHNENSDETGIVVAAKKHNGDIVVLDDLSGIYDPETWVNIALQAYHDYHCNVIVAEVNQGGNMVETLIKHQSPCVNFKPLRAHLSKYERALPISLLYAKGRIIHQKPLPILEQQLIDFDQGVKGAKDDRVDALVWGIKTLLEAPPRPSPVFEATWLDEEALEEL